MMKKYQLCVKCIMDTSDPYITFDKNGVCNHCRAYEFNKKQYDDSPKERDEKLQGLVEEIKKTGLGKEFDCILGVSGGVDSTYAAFIMKKLGLRPLAVHMDNGWDSELAVSNVRNTLEKLDMELLTEVLDWEEFRDLQLSFLKASVSDAEIPTDHAIWAVLYQTADKYDIPYIIDGSNFATEGISVPGWTYGIWDWEYIKNVHRIFGERQLESYPHFSRQDELYLFKYKGLKVIQLLNYIEYNKEEAMETLQKELDWRPYGGKHYESIYTRFFQGYILPEKFGIDKRKAHLSTLIYSGQASREEALKEMLESPYEGYEIESDKEYVIKKLQLSAIDFDDIMSLPVKTQDDYPHYIKDLADNEIDAKTAPFIREVVMNRMLYLLEKHGKLALFPNGRHTEWLTSVVKEKINPNSIIIFDDNLEGATEVNGYKAFSSSLVPHSEFKAALLSSDLPSNNLVERADKLFGDKLEKIYTKGLPKGPYCKH